MAQKIGIGVSAELDTSSVEQKINDLGQKIAQANKVQFTPLRDSTAEDLDRILKQFEQLRRIQADLNRRMKQTGQADTPMLNADWDKLYVDPAVRARQMRKAFEYATGTAFHEPVPQPEQQRRSRRDERRPEDDRPRRPDRGSLPGMGASVAQAGLRAAGPAGGVAAGALGTGMAAGFGAGLMGLLGGIVALGVGKAVGAVVGQMGQAEDNAVAFDRLKRVLGDVNVSFGHLKTSLQGSATAATVTIDEAARLTTQFAKLGNVARDRQYELADEMDTGVGLSRAYGLDPSQGVGVMGQLRGMRITGDVQDSRRFALLIGETIGKSGAFARADEVMEALSTYATTQTRNAMSAANLEGFGGLYSSMVGSGMAGMDPAGANALIARLNAALSQGGAHGEASQFASALVAREMGLNPLQMQVLREGGAFATASQMFGKDSAYARYMGREGPSGDETFYSGTRRMIERMHPGQTEQEKLLRAQAFGNHAGLNLNQAMSLLSIAPNEMGGLQQYVGNLGELNTAGINSLYSVVYGSEEERTAVANELYSRRDLETGKLVLSTEEREDLDRVMTEGSAEDQRQVLSALIASRDQERTQGKDIRDSKVALDNIKTSLADRLIPITQEIRQGIMYMAGGQRGKSPRDIIEEMMKLDHRDREKDIRAEFDSDITAIDEEYSERLKDIHLRHGEARRAEDDLYRENQPRFRSGEITQEEHQAQMEPLQEQTKSIAREDADLRDWRSKSKAEAKERRDKALKAENESHQKNLRELRESGSPTAEDLPDTGRYQVRGVGDGLPVESGGEPVPSEPPKTPSRGRPGDNVSRFVDKYGPLADRVAERLGVPPEAVLGQWGLETGWGKSIIPGTNNLGNIKDFSGKGPVARDNMTGSVDSYRAYGSEDEFGDAFAEFLSGRRYRDVKGAQTPLEYFSTLKQGGYAEDPDYVRKGVVASDMAKRAMERGHGVQTPVQPVDTETPITLPEPTPAEGAKPVDTESPVKREAPEATERRELKPSDPIVLPEPILPPMGARPVPNEPDSVRSFPLPERNIDVPVPTREAQEATKAFTDSPDEAPRQQIAERSRGTPLPADVSASRERERQQVLVKIDGGEFTLKDQQGVPRADPIPMSTRVHQPNPFGTSHA